MSEEGTEEPRLGWGQKLKIWNRKQDDFIEASLFTLLLLCYTLLCTPFERILLSQKSERLKHLAGLDPDGLCRELVAGKDFDTGIVRQGGAKSSELENIAEYICELCAKGNLSQYPQLHDITLLEGYWRALMSKNAGDAQLSLSIGFYIGVGLTALVVFLI